MRKKLNCILLIDDNADDNFFHERIIKKADCTEKIISFLSAKEAIKFIIEKRFNPELKAELIFLDINMPGMNGWDFLEEYNNLDDELKSKVVVVMLTTSTNPDDLNKAKEIPSLNNFCTKPLTLKLINELFEEHFPSYL